MIQGVNCLYIFGSYWRKLHQSVHVYACLNFISISFFYSMILSASSKFHLNFHIQIIISSCHYYFISKVLYYSILFFNHVIPDEALVILNFCFIPFLFFYKTNFFFPENVSFLIFSIIFILKYF